MTSINAENVAKEILGTIGTKKKTSVRAIAPKHGYSLKTANSGQIQKTKSYQNILNPVINKWIKERDRLTKSLSERDLSTLAYRDGIDAIDKLTKNIQLLTGGSTENVALKTIIIQKSNADSDHSTPSKTN